MATPLELAGAYARTEKGNNDQYYGGGDIGYVNAAAACAFVPLVIRPGKTVGIIEGNKVIEYIWHPNDLSNTGLVLKTAAVDLTAINNRIDAVEAGAPFSGLNPGNINDLNQVGLNKAGGIYRLDFNNTPIVNAPLVTNSLQVVQAGNNGRGLRLMGGYLTDRYFLQRASTEAGGWQPAVEVYHTGNLVTAVLAMVVSSLSTVAGAPVNTDNLVTILSKFKYLYDNLGLLVRGALLTTYTIGSNAAIAATDSILTAFGKLQAQVNNRLSVSSVEIYAALTGTDTYTGTASAITALATGTVVNVLPANANTGPATFNLNGLGARSITKAGGALLAGDLPAGQINQLIYDGGSWQMGASNAAGNKLNAGANPSLAGAGERVVTAGSTGVPAATFTVLERRVTDADITGAVASVTFNSGNNFTAPISPTNSKSILTDQWFASGSYKYEAVSTNVVQRIPLG